MTNLVSPSQFLKTVLEKGKTFAEGTVRTWGGKTYKKTGGKWLPYSGKGKPARDISDLDSRPLPSKKIIASPPKMSKPTKAVYDVIRHVAELGEPFSVRDIMKGATEKEVEAARSKKKVEPGVKGPFGGPVTYGGHSLFEWNDRVLKQVRNLVKQGVAEPAGARGQFRLTGYK